jgi:VWFA-related protein
MVVFAAPAPQRPAASPVVLYFDAASMTADELSRAADAAIRFVETRLADGQNPAVIVSNGKAKVRSDFTADREVLKQALRGVAAQSAGGGSDAGARLANLRRAIAMLAPLEGRKAVVYFSAGSPTTSLQAANDDAQHANVAVYVIDPRQR